MHSVLLVGLGKIGAEYKNIITKNNKKVTRNHLDAILSSPKFQLVGIIEPNKAKFKKHPHLANIPHYSSLKNLNPSPKMKIDCTIIASPTDTHYANLQEALRLKSKIVIVEKPLCQSLEDSEAALNLVKQSHSKAYVNYSRRLDPRHIQLKDLMTSPPLKITGYYSKDLYNYGSHMIDIIQYWFGPLKQLKLLSENTQCQNPMISFIGKLSRGTEVAIFALEGTDYDVFELDIFFKEKKITLTNSGVDIEVYQSTADLYYPGYNHLKKIDVSLSQPEQFSGIEELYSQIDLILQGHEHELPLCSIEEAYEVDKSISNIIGFVRKE